MKATTFTTSRVILLDRIIEGIKMWRYMRNFRKARLREQWRWATFVESVNI